MTLTNAIEIDCPVLVCDAEDDGNNSARICISTGTDTEPIRPILTIDKKYLK